MKIENIQKITLSVDDIVEIIADKLEIPTYCVDLHICENSDDWGEDKWISCIIEKKEV